MAILPESLNRGNKDLKDRVSALENYIDYMQERIEFSGSNSNSKIRNAEEVLSELPLTMFPLGAVFMTVEDTDPADCIGGEWEEINSSFSLGSETAHVWKRTL